MIKADIQTSNINILFNLYNLNYYHKTKKPRLTRFFSAGKTWPHKLIFIYLQNLLYHFFAGSFVFFLGQQAFVEQLLQLAQLVGNTGVCRIIGYFLNK